MIDFQQSYVNLARGLADALRAYARERRTDDKKEVARLQTELCNIRRDELAASSSADPGASSSEQ